MIKEKSILITLDKIEFYALLDKLNKNNITVKLTYETRNNNSQVPFIVIENVELDTKIDTSDEYNFIRLKKFNGVNAGIDFPDVYIEYEVSYLYDFVVDENKIGKLPKEVQGRVGFYHLISEKIPEEYRKRIEQVTISIKGINYSLILDLDCSWKLFDFIINNIDIYRKQILDNIADYKSYELIDSMIQPEEFWESIYNMLENI